MYTFCIIVFVIDMIGWSIIAINLYLLYNSLWSIIGINVYILYDRHDCWSIMVCAQSVYTFCIIFCDGGDIVIDHGLWSITAINVYILYKSVIDMIVDQSWFVNNHNNQCSLFVIVEYYMLLEFMVKELFAVNSYNHNFFIYAITARCQWH